MSERNDSKRRLALNYLTIEKNGVKRLNKTAVKLETQFIRKSLMDNGILRRLFESCPICSANMQKIRYYIDREYPHSLFNIKSPKFSISYTESLSRLHKTLIEEVQNQEDNYLIDKIESIIASNPDQSVTIPWREGITYHDIFCKAKELFANSNLSFEKILIHGDTNELLKHYPNGVTKILSSAYDEDFVCLSGISIMRTFESRIVPQKVVYFFAPQKDFCNFFLDDAKFEVQNDGSIYHCLVFENLLLDIINTKGVAKLMIE